VKGGGGEGKVVFKRGHDHILGFLIHVAKHYQFAPCVGKLSS
jgi:hypothetical protein